MAVAALLISLVSLYYTHKTLQINEHTSRAIIQVSNARLLSNWGWDDSVEEPVRIEITLANLGKSLARNISVDLSFGTCYETSMVTPKRDASRTGCVTFGTDKLLVDDLGPGATRTYEKKVPTTSEMFFSGGDDAKCAPWRTPDPVCRRKVKITELSVIPNFRYVDSIGIYEYAPCFVNRADIRGVVKAGTVYPCLTQKRREFTPLTNSWE
jgi:hypothetical protein